MKERPILFSGAMVRALLDGRKTQTRRIVKPQPVGRPWFWAGDEVDPEPGWFDGYETGRMPCGAAEREVNDPMRCLYGIPGDRLWVRESFWGCDMPGYGDQPCVVYEDEWHGKEYRAAEVRPYARRFGHIPGIHMPRDASRITLEVTGVRVELLQSISDEDARAEGTPCYVCDRALDGHGDADCHCFHRQASASDFRMLWDGLNADRGYGWDTNPWVWVVEFKRIDA